MLASLLETFAYPVQVFPGRRYADLRFFLENIENIHHSFQRRGIHRPISIAVVIDPNPAVSFPQALHTFHRRRLASTVGADEAEDLASIYFERHVGDGDR